MYFPSLAVPVLARTLAPQQRRWHPDAVPLLRHANQPLVAEITYQGEVKRERHVDLQRNKSVHNDAQQERDKLIVHRNYYMRCILRYST